MCVCVCVCTHNHPQGRGKIQEGRRKGSIEAVSQSHPSRPLPTYAMLYVITEHWAELCVIQQLPVIHMVVYIWWWWCSR